MIASARRREAIESIRPYVQRAESSSGWSFRALVVRPLGPPVPWSYEERAKELLHTASVVLDMGTGGGELFADMLQGYRGRAVATESWATNVPVAARRLASTGAVLVRSHSLRLPFRDDTFALVLNRHEELDPAEVARVLAAHGRILTQQVGRGNWQELKVYFPRKQDFGPLFEGYRSGFQTAGLSIVRADRHAARVAYGSLGDVVYMLCAAPWEISDFSPLDHDLEALIEMERDLRTDDGIVLTEDRFLIEAQKR